MASQTWLTVLGGFISGLVGVGLFFLQRFKAGRDEQQRLLFRVYQLMVVPARGEWTRDSFATFQNDSQIHYAWLQEIKSLAVLIKDKDLAKEIYFHDKKSKDERDLLIKEIGRRISPKLIKRIDKEPAPAPSTKAAQEPKK